ncbi:hypothetical protein [Microcoleus sp. Z1_C3]|uniref:hypothetical protein n=1 Tax=unclassified Microcoleus TaxID=2642155 RepID=UPI002FD0C779
MKSIIPSNISYPILFNILIKADAETQHLHLTAYNLEFGGTQMNFDKYPSTGKPYRPGTHACLNSAKSC